MLVEVRKIGKYDPTLGAKYSRYEGYCLSTTQKSSPAIIQEAEQDLKREAITLTGEAIYHSTLLRGKQPALAISGIKLLS